MLSRKLLLVISVALVGVISYLFYSPTQTKTPPKRTTCEILIIKLLEAKTQDEKDFAENRWRLLCVKENP